MPACGVKVVQESRPVVSFDARRERGHKRLCTSKRNVPLTSAVMAVTRRQGGACVTSIRASRSLSSCAGDCGHFRAPWSHLVSAPPTNSAGALHGFCLRAPASRRTLDSRCGARPTSGPGGACSSWPSACSAASTCERATCSTFLEAWRTPPAALLRLPCAHCRQGRGGSTSTRCCTGPRALRRTCAGVRSSRWKHVSSLKSSPASPDSSCRARAWPSHASR